MTDYYVTLTDLNLQNRFAVLRALDSYRQYACNARSRYLDPRRCQFQALSEERRRLLREHLCYEKTLDDVENAIDVNSQIALGIYQTGCAKLSEQIKEIHAPHTWHGTATDFDCSISRTCIRAMFRDWSAEGCPERKASHLPILKALEDEFGSAQEKMDVPVLVPGAGLGRLIHSIGELGLSVEGNDMSYHTLLARMFIFTDGLKIVSKALYPWALSFSNHISRQHHFQKIMIPDLSPAGQIRLVRDSSPCGGKHTTFTTGDFVKMYKSPTFTETFSAIANCYFIDTAPNVIDYIETAHNCLRTGGIWINIGPLLWNAEENGPSGNGEGDIDGQECWNSKKRCSSPENPVLELAAEEIVSVLQQKGFSIQQFSHDMGESPYIGNESSMLQYRYKMAFWVARKR